MPLELALFTREANPTRYIAKDGGLYVVMHGHSAATLQLAPALARDAYVLGGVDTQVVSWPAVLEMLGLVIRFDASAMSLHFNKATVFVSRVGFMLDRLMAYASRHGYLTGELQMHQLRIWFSTVQLALIASDAATSNDFLVTANGFIWLSALRRRIT